MFPASPASSWRLFATIFRCESRTPLGNPVVPDEYTKNAKSFRGSILVLRNRVAPEIFLIEVKCLNLFSGCRSSPINMTRSREMPAFCAASSATFSTDM